MNLLRSAATTGNALSRGGGEGTLMPQSIAGAVRREARVLNSATVSVTLRARPSAMAENSTPTSLPTSGLASIPFSRLNNLQALPPNMTNGQSSSKAVLTGMSVERQDR